jgi:heat shock protein HslJ
MRFNIIAGILLFNLLSVVCQAKGNKTFIVADRTAACAGDFECIQIKEKAKDQWRFYSDTIQGFNYEEGYQYKISVQPVQTLNSLTGIYDEKYKLVHIISKKRTSYNPSDKLGDKKWILISMNDTHRTLTFYDTTVVIYFSLKDGKIKGKNVCNGFTGTFTTQASKISLSNITSTKMMCKGMELEKIIFEFYLKMVSFKTNGTKLILTQADGSNIVFEGR